MSPQPSPKFRAARPARAWLVAILQCLCLLVATTTGAARSGKKAASEQDEPKAKTTPAEAPAPETTPASEKAKSSSKVAAKGKKNADKKASTETASAEKKSATSKETAATKAPAPTKAPAAEKKTAPTKETAAKKEKEAPATEKKADSAKPAASTPSATAKTAPAEAKAAPAPAPAKTAPPAPATSSAAPVSFVVSIPEQRIFVFNAGGEKVATYRVSTSAHGLGDGRGTYATPLGYLEVASKIGAGAPVGAVFKGGHRTGEICAINAPGRDPIITRILHLRGLEKGNESAYARCIYIHGTPDERKIGKQVSYGCIRMRSADVVELFDLASVGTRVEITQDRVTNMFGSVVRAPAPIGAGPSPIIKPAPGLIAKADQPTDAAKVAGKTEKRATVAVNPQIALSTRREPPPSAPSKPTPKDPHDSHIKLMETSVLNIQFGGGTERDRRDR